MRARDLGGGARRHARAEWGLLGGPGARRGAAGRVRRRDLEGRGGEARGWGPQPLSAAGLLFLRGRDADARLRALEAQRVRVRPVLGALAARLSERRSWRELGFRSLSDFARERLGVGARTVSEWARVWRALGELPLLREAVLSGEVSWTVARRVVRVATPENQAACLATVRGRTVRAVEALLAAVAAAEGAEEGPEGSVSPGSDAEGEDGVAVLIACPSAIRGQWSAAVELAQRVAGEELPVWACAEAIAAEVASALPVEPGPGDSREPPVASSGSSAPLSPSIGPGDPESGLRHRAFPHLSWRPVKPCLPGQSELELERLAAGIEECSPHELDRRLRAAVAFLQGLDLELGRLLRQVIDRRLHREVGFETFERYLRERLDTAPRTARRLVRLARAERRAPRVADAFRRGRVSAFQADLLLAAVGRRGRDTADPDLELRWLALARSTTLRRLEREVRAEPRAAVAFHAPPAVAAFFGETLERVRRGLGGVLPPWVALEAMLDHAIRTWTQVGSRFRDTADFERDGYRCTVPGCTARSRLESHHTRFRSAGGPDVPENRTTLCWFHHRAGVHEGRVRISGRAPERLLFELGVRSDGPPLARYRSGDVAV